MFKMIEDLFGKKFYIVCHKSQYQEVNGKSLIEYIRIE